LENHFSDIIVKFHRLDESIRAYEGLKSEFKIAYVPTKIDSDRANQYKHFTSESQNDANQRASYTLNMLKIQNEDDKIVSSGQYGALGR
jgi:hypothetical protein